MSVSRTQQPEYSMLWVGSPYATQARGSLFDSVDDDHAVDRQEMMDAAHECAHGRLPHDTTPECGCWGAVVIPLPEWDTEVFEEAA